MHAYLYMNHCIIMILSLKLKFEFEVIILLKTGYVTP